MDNIYKKINKVMQDVEYLTKDDKVSTGNGNGYKAITEEKVTATVRQSLIKNGVVIIPIRQEHTREDEKVIDRYGSEKINRLTTVNTTYRIQNIEDKDDYIEAVSSGTGVDTQDKGIGKAMTYAYKYLLLRTFAIPTGEDPDKISSDLYTQQFGDGNEKISPQNVKVLQAVIKNMGEEGKKLYHEILEENKIEKLEELTQIQYGKALKKLQK